MSLASLFRGDAGNTPTDDLQIGGNLDGNNILAPLFTPDVPIVTDQLRVAGAIARTTGASLQVSSHLAIVDRMPIESCQEPTGTEESALIEWAVDQVRSSASDIDGGILSSRGLVKTVQRLVGSNDIDTLVVPGTSSTNALRRGITERLATTADCDVITVNGQTGYEAVSSILLPIAGGPHSGLAADVAQSLATDCDAWIDVLCVIDEDATDRQQEAAEAQAEAALQRIGRPDTTTSWILEAADATAAIVEQSTYYELTIIGAPTIGRLRQFVYGSTSRSIRNNAQSLVLSARNNRGSADSDAA